MTAPNTFQAVFRSTTGIGRYKLDDTFHRVFTYDGASSGKLDHLVLYRPGKGDISVLRNTHGQPHPTYEAKKGGIGGFDLAFYYDRALAFDYDHSGRLDHIICYRPGAGACFILKHDARGGFTPVYAMPAAEKPTPKEGRGIGGWDLRYPWDRLFAFDFDHSKKLDHICIYRRVQKKFHILKNAGGKFQSVYANGTGGIGGYTMGNEEDYAWAIDWDHTGCRDHILFIRFDGRWGTPDSHSPMTSVIKHQGNTFTTVFHNTDVLGGLGLNNHDLRAFTYDYLGSGMMDCIGCWLPGQGVCWIVQGGKQLLARYHQGVVAHDNVPAAPGQGIGGCDLKNDSDRCLAFDYDGSGRNDHILIWRLGTGDVWIMRNHVMHPLAVHH